MEDTAMGRFAQIFSDTMIITIVCYHTILFEEKLAKYTRDIMDSVHELQSWKIQDSF